MMMLRLLNTMAIAAVFYGSSNGTFIGDISLSFIESLLGFIPMFALKMLIVRRRPTTKEIKKYSIEKAKETQTQLNATILSNTPSRSTRHSRNASTDSITTAGTVSTGDNPIILF